MALAAVSWLDACDGGGAREPDDAQPVAAQDDARPVEVTADTPTVAPSGSWPVPQTFDVPTTTIDRLPVSKRFVGRASKAENLLEVMAIPGRPESARVVFEGHVFEDVRDPATWRRLVRWFDARHLRPVDGWIFDPRGTAIVAESAIVASLVGELIALASGEDYGGPVDVILRQPGTRAMTAIPVVLDDAGLDPSATWGEWAVAIDGESGDAPAVLAIPDTDALWRFRRDLANADTTVRIRVQPWGLQSTVTSHRNEIESCYIQGVVFDPDLQGTWSLAITRQRWGNTATVAVTRQDAGAGIDDRLVGCLLRAAKRWHWPVGDEPVVVELVATVRH